MINTTYNIPKMFPANGNAPTKAATLPQQKQDSCTFTANAPQQEGFSKKGLMATLATLLLAAGCTGAPAPETPELVQVTKGPAITLADPGNPEILKIHPNTDNHNIGGTWITTESDKEMIIPRDNIVSLSNFIDKPDEACMIDTKGQITITVDEPCDDVARQIWGVGQTEQPQQPQSPTQQ